MPQPVMLSWSSGKDCAWALHRLREQPNVEVVGLITTVHETTGRVPIHFTRRELVEAQAAAVGLPLTPVGLPWPCTNVEYERRLGEALHRAKAGGVTGVAFGDLHLADIRAYREQFVTPLGLEAHFPIWCEPGGSPGLARAMQSAGLRAIVTCVDPAKLSPDQFLGREWDAHFLSDLPAGVDPCGENGEFHTFCFDGPMFRDPVQFRHGWELVRDGLHGVDLLPT